MGFVPRHIRLCAASSRSYSSIVTTPSQVCASLSLVASLFRSRVGPRNDLYACHRYLVRDEIAYSPTYLGFFNGEVGSVVDILSNQIGVCILSLVGMLLRFSYSLCTCK